jgi:hypothetical protein
MWKRTVIVVLSGWVLFAGYLWPHTRAHLLNNWIVGVGLLVFGTAAYRNTWARYVTLLLAAWLFGFSAIFERSDPRTFWNDAMVAVLICVLSLLGPKQGWLSRPSEPSRARG